MKVVFINPNYRTKLGKSEKISSILPPLGIAYIASFLREKKIDSSIIDMNACNYSVEDSIQILSKMREFPKIVGITVTTPTILRAFEQYLR